MSRMDGKKTHTHTLCSFPFWMAFFYLVTTGWILTYEVIALSENFIGQSRYDTPFDIIEQRFRVLSQIIKFAAVKSITCTDHRSFYVSPVLLILTTFRIADSTKYVFCSLFVFRSETIFYARMDVLVLKKTKLCTRRVRVSLVLRNIETFYIDEAT